MPRQIPFSADLTGEMLRAGRAIARVDQAELAELAGVSLETIKRLERIRGVVNASTSTLRSLALAFARLEVTFFADASGRPCVRQGGGDAVAPLISATPGQAGLLCRAVYHSIATDETARNADAVVDEIVAAALERNGPLSITGALLYADGRFLQALEGEPRDVWHVLGGIAMDPRHRHFTPVSRAVVTERLFPDWVLCSADWRSGFHPATMQADDLLALLLELSARERMAILDS